MKVACNILAVICLVMATVLAFFGDYSHAAYLMGLACFNRLNAMEIA